jgi:hypothetical protein
MNKEIGDHFLIECQKWPCFHSQTVTSPLFGVSSMRGEAVQQVCHFQ